MNRPLIGLPMLVALTSTLTVLPMTSGSLLGVCVTAPSKSCIAFQTLTVATESVWSTICTCQPYCAIRSPGLPEPPA